MASTVGGVRYETSDKGVMSVFGPSGTTAIPGLNVAGRSVPDASIFSPPKAAASISVGNPDQEAIALSAQLNPLYLANFKASMNTLAPGASDLLGKNITSLLSGKLPDDVTAMIEQTAAEQNLSQGRFGEAASARTMRDIGKSSLDAIQMGAGLLKGFTPELPNIEDLINKQRAYDVEKTKMDISQSQFAQGMAEQQSEFQTKTALQQLQMALGQNEFEQTQALQEKKMSEGKREFDIGMDWEKTVSDWNKKYETWANGQQQVLGQQLAAKGQQTAQAIIDQKKSSADRESAARMQASQDYMAQLMAGGGASGGMSLEAMMAEYIKNATKGDVQTVYTNLDGTVENQPQPKKKPEEPKKEPEATGQWTDDPESPDYWDF